MRMTARASGHTVRPASPWEPQKLLFYLALFGVTGLAVYRWGLAKAQPSKPAGSYTSTATIHLGEGLQAAADPQKIQRQITSKENLHRAVRQLALAARPPANEDLEAAADRAVETVSQNLQVTAGGTSLPGEVAVSITYTDRYAHYPARLVNTLAESYAADCRQEWKRRTYRAYTEAREASERAEQEFLQAKARLEEFSRQHFKPGQARQPDDTFGPEQEQTDNARASSAEVHESDSLTAAPATPPPVDNPRWVELNQRLAALKRRLAQLLVDRTPLHPEVRDTELRITALEQQLSATPRKIPPNPSGLPPTADQALAAQEPAPPAEIPPAQTAPQRAETAQRFRTLQQAADRATKAYHQAFLLERQAWHDHQREPRIELDLAELIQAPTSPAPPRLALLLGALAAASAVAAGVGMISAGSIMQPPLTTVEQVRSVLPVPIVGTIPETSPATQPAAAPRQRPLIRWTLIAGGLVLIAGCVGSLLWAWRG